MTVYIDVILIENLIMNYIILYASAIIIKLKISHVRFLVSSLIGAIYTIGALTFTINEYAEMIIKILLSIIMVYIAYIPQTIKFMWKQLLFFYLVSFVFGGVAFFLIYFIRPQDIVIRNGVFIGNYVFKILFLGTIISFVLVVFIFKIIKNKKSIICQIKIEVNKKIIETNAMIDTGNLLKDPITNMPVIIVENILLYDILPKQILNNLEKILGGEINEFSEEIKTKYISKLKIIPFSSLGKEHGMLIGIRADTVYIKHEYNYVERDNIIIGIYDKALSKNGEYNALIGANLL